MKQQKADLARELQAAGFSAEDAESYASRAKLSYLLITQACDLEALPLGASRLGGTPDAFEGFSWPVHDEFPLEFLAQIDLATVESPLLPAEGWLLFFYDAAKTPPHDTVDAAGHPSARVIHVLGSRDNLVRMPAPEGSRQGPMRTLLPPSFETFAVELRRSIDLPCPYELFDAYYEVESDEAEDQLTAYCTLVEKLEGRAEATSRLLGYERANQSLPELHALSATDSDWHLLLQLDSYGHSGGGPSWVWGDMGELLFWIHEADLRASSFDNVRVLIAP